MPKAVQASSTSRRAMLAGVMTLSIAGPAHAIAGGDARLIELCHQFAAIRQQLDQPPPLHPGEPGYGQALQARNTLCRRECVVLEDISILPARSLAGLSAKARAVKLYLPDHLAASIVEPEQPEVQVVISLLHDLVTFAKEASL